MEGGGIPPAVEGVTAGSLSLSGEVRIATRFHSFAGRYGDNALTGDLRQGSETVWGGQAGSNRIVLRRGTNLPGVPERELASVREIEAWVATLR